jgi:TolB-like protein
MGLVVAVLAGAAVRGVGAEKADPQAPIPSVTVAILDYEATAPGNPQLGSQVADLLTARLSMEEGFDLVERARLHTLLEEQQLTLRGLTDEDRAAKVGRLLGAKLMVLGKAFLMDKKLMFVSKVVGVETGVVKGTLRQVEQSAALSEAVVLLAEDVVGVIRKNAARILGAGDAMPDPIGQLRKDWGDRPRPTVAVVIPEEHRRREPAAPPVDPAVETEIKRTLIACGIPVVDVGQNALADWARDMMKGKHPAWPAAIQGADIVIVGEAFSEFAVRTGDLVTCAGRAEINVIDRHTGRILHADRQTARGVDLAEHIAGKTALQAAGRKLGIAACRSLIGYTRPAAAPKPEAKPAHPAGGTASAAPRRPALVLFAPRMDEAKFSPEKPPPAGPKKRTVFPAPFDNESGQEQYDPAAAGMGDLVGVLLAEQEHITVVERQRLLALAEEQAKSLRGLTGDKYAIQAGKLLKADTVLVGRLYLVEGKLMVSVKALEIETARVMAADELACRPEDILEAALQLARRLAKQMALPLPQIDLKAIDSSPIASLHFAKAIGHYYGGNMDAAIMQLMRTLDLDPDYVEAHYWAGMCYYRLEEFDHALIEWKKYFQREPHGKYVSGLKKLVLDAKAKAADSGVPRLGPKEKAQEGGNK